MKRFVLAAIAIAFVVAPTSAFALQQNPDGNSEEKTETMTFKEGEDLTGVTPESGIFVTGDDPLDLDNFKLVRTDFTQELLDSAGEI